MNNNTFTPFLKRVVDDLYSLYGDNMSDVTIIAPNKRVSLFFNKYLSEHIGDTPIWSPDFMTIGDLFQELSPLKLADPIQQICTLYEAYVSVSGSTETLDKFYSWAELMKSDFDDIDNNMTNAQMLFSNIRDLEAMKDFSYLSQGQVDAIRRYFEHFNSSDTQLKQKFMDLWQYMLAVYEKNRQLLRQKGMAYSGMLKRDVIESKSFDFSGKVYVIVGFNVLNETEKALFHAIKKERPDSLFYWDYDTAYLDFEAGRFVKENIRDFGNRFKEDDTTYNLFSNKSKITFISAPTENAQTRYVDKWIRETVDSNNQIESAVILCNENILQPVLHAIPEKLGDNETELNVTMGYPLTETPIYSFVTALINLQLHGKSKQSDGWRYTQVAAVLKHPYTKTMVGEDVVHILSYLKRKNVMFPESAQLYQVREKMNDDDKWVAIDSADLQPITFLREIFSPVDGCKQLVEYLMNFVRQIGKKYRDDVDRLKARQDFELQLYAESVFSAYNVLSRVHTILEREPIFNVSLLTLCRLLTQMFAQQSIPFHGEPAKGIQVMGVLETRNLDFRNVILLSCGEGLLPKSDRMASIIPYTLREAYGMTTIERQVSLFAFYFYNILQRSENITIMYNNNNEGPSRGEMSRFMMQLMVESKKLFGRTDVIELQSLTAVSSNPAIGEVEVERTPEVIERLSAIDHISPTAINCFIDCPLKFYFSNVAKLQVDEEVTEEVDSRLFGNIFHKAMEIVYTDFVDRWVEADVLRNLADSKAVEQAVDNAFAIEFFKEEEIAGRCYRPNYSGEQLLNRHVILSYVKNQIRFDAQSCPMRILGIEKYHSTTLTLGDGKRKMRIGGIIDRYEEIMGENGVPVVRIVDYKTSTTAQTARSVEELFTDETSKRAYHILQALYYSEVMSENNEIKKPISPSLMYIKSAPASRKAVVEIGKDNKIVDYVRDIKSQYRDALISKLDEIFLSDEPFRQNANHTCAYCKFYNFCNK